MMALVGIHQARLLQLKCLSLKLNVRILFNLARAFILSGRLSRPQLGELILYKRERERDLSRPQLQN